MAVMILVKLGSISFLVQITSFFYNGSFLAIGMTLSATIVASLMLCHKLLKMDNVLEEV